MLSPWVRPDGKRIRERQDAWLHDHVEALRVRCPACSAAPDHVCVNPLTGRPLAGSPGHWQRLRLSRAARPDPPAPLPWPREPGDALDDNPDPTAQEIPA